MSVRLHVLGRIALEHGDLVVDEDGVPGRQGRAALAFLALQRTRPVSRDALAEAVWPGAQPSARDTGLNALVSKLRRWFASAGLDGGEVLVGSAGTYGLRLPPGVWVDVEVATRRLDRARAARRAGRFGESWTDATVASAILRRPLLVGLDAEWIDRRRRLLGQQLVDALDCVGDAWIARGQPELAVPVAEEAVGRDPFREALYRTLIRAHVAAGDRAQALLVYERCRRLLRAELGVDPGPETEALFHDLLSGS